jgi:DNA repair protein RadC
MGINFGGCDQVLKVLYLNSQNQIIDTVDLFEGTINSSSISPREVIVTAIKHSAVSLIFVHNHPSGNPEPSQTSNLSEVTTVLIRESQNRIKDEGKVSYGENG